MPLPDPHVLSPLYLQLGEQPTIGPDESWTERAMAAWPPEPRSAERLALQRQNVL